MRNPQKINTKTCSSSFELCSILASSSYCFGFGPLTYVLVNPYISHNFIVGHSRQLYWSMYSAYTLRQTDTVRDHLLNTVAHYVMYLSQELVKTKNRANRRVNIWFKSNRWSEISFVWSNLWEVSPTSAASPQSWTRRFEGPALCVGFTWREGVRQIDQQTGSNIMSGSLRRILQVCSQILTELTAVLPANNTTPFPSYADFFLVQSLLCWQSRAGGLWSTMYFRSAHAFFILDLLLEFLIPLSLRCEQSKGFHILEIHIFLDENIYTLFLSVW